MKEIINRSLRKARTDCLSYFIRLAKVSPVSFGVKCTADLRTTAHFSSVLRRSRFGYKLLVPPTPLSLFLLKYVYSLKHPLDSGIVPMKCPNLRFSPLVLGVVLVKCSHLR